MQHIMVFPDGTVAPPTASVWRDDQTLMWILGPGLAWPKDVIHPIVFLGAEPPHYAAWPGSAPAPIGDPPNPGEPDTRSYVALANKLNESDSVVMYHYEISQVQNIETNEVFRVRVEHPERPEWYDPDVGNQPYP